MPRMLERMIKVRDTLKIRKKSDSQPQPQPQPQSQRNMFAQAKQRMDTVSNRIQQRKPKLFSQANEALGSWQPGNRITKIMPVDFGKRRTARKKKTTKELDFSMSVQSP